MSLFALAASGGPLRQGVRVFVLPAVSLWLIELLSMLFRSDQPLGLLRLQGLFAALGLSVLLATLLGLHLGAVLVLSSAKPSDWGARLRAFLWDGDQSTQEHRVGTLLGAALGLLLYAGAAFLVTRTLLLGMAQPHFAALAIVGSHLLLGLPALALYPACRRLCTLFVYLLLAVPWLRLCVANAGRVLVLAVTLGAGIALLGVFLFWKTLMFLPWEAIGSVLGACALALYWQALLARLRPLAVFERFALALLLPPALLALVLLDARDEESRRTLYATLGGSLGQAVAVLALDFDRDGQLHVFGGGDCAPFDARFSPVAIDVPNNNLDEDCDGTDLDQKRLGIELRRDFDVPGSFPKRPAIVLVTIDAFAADRMRALGGRREVTPYLDAFAKRSTLFRSAFSQGPSTRLAFPSIFTSRWDSQIKQRLEGNHPFPIEGSELLLAEALARHGYETVAVVSDSYFSKRRWGSLTAGFTEVIESPMRGGAEKHNSSKVTDVALQAWQRTRKRPLFLWVHYYDAHWPHAQPPEIERFGTARADIYDAELKFVDREVGRLLTGLESATTEAPLIFVTADHGIAFDRPRHARFNYGYDLSSAVLHVPLIVHGPQIGAQVLDGLVSTMDIAPTIANLARIKRSLPFEGASLLPELLAGTRSRPERLLHQFFLQERLYTDADPLEQIALRTQRYNLVHNRKQGTYELYDWKADYFETRNLADAPAHRAALQALRQQLALMTYRVYDRQRAPAAASAHALRPE